MARTFQFGPFRLDERERTLERDGTAIALTPKSFDVLRILLSNANYLTEKGALLSSVWEGVYVDEAVLTRAISDLRKALAGDQTWIETVPKFGYRFTGEVRVIDPSAPAPAPAQGQGRRWLLPVVAALAVGLVAMVWGRGSTQRDSRIHRLAILPFQTVGTAPDRSALGLGLADALITRLSLLHGLVVAPLSLIRRYEAGAVDPMQAARQLQADAVLEGTVQEADGLVRVSLRLIRARDGKALWTSTAESAANRLFALEDSLAEQVARKVAAELKESERIGLAANSELNARAHRLYVDGRYEWGKRTREGLESGAKYFRQAIDLDSHYARAFAGLADCYLLLGLYGHAPPLEMLPEAKKMARRALELDATLAEARATLGLIAQNLDWDWKEVERQYREAIRLAPNHATAHHWLAEFLSIRGRFAEAEAEFARARELDPISPIIPVDEAQLYFFQRRYDRALAVLERVAKENPSFALTRERIAFVHLIEGRDDAAWREAMTLPECREPGGDCQAMWTAWLPRLNPAAAQRSLARLEERASVGGVPLYAVMFAHLRQGHIDTAVDWLEQMHRSHGVWLITAKVNPLFDALRGQSRARMVLASVHPP